MRKLVFSLSLIFFSLGSFAQFKGGIEAGLNFSTWVGSIADFDYKMGFYVGGKVIYYLNNEMLVQSGVYYSRDGWKKQVKINNEDVTQALDLNYLVIPLDFGVFAVGDRYRGLKFNFGVDFKYLLNYSLVNELSTGNQDGEPEVELNDFDINAKIGIDYKIDESIAFSLLAYLGTFKVNKTKTPQISSMYNLGFRIGVYYIF